MIHIITEIMKEIIGRGLGVSPRKVSVCHWVPS